MMQSSRRTERHGNGAAVTLPLEVFARPSGDGDPDATLLIESILFVAAGPVSIGALAQALVLERRVIDKALEILEAQLADRGVRLQQSGDLVQLVTAAEAGPAVQRFLGLEASAKLSGPALETLAIVAYRQPVTRPEVETLRGVNCDAVLRTLITRGLVAEVGRRETVGHPVEYGTTFLFLEYFGLRDLHDLPPVEEFAAGARANGQVPEGTGEDLAPAPVDA
jgi:segregation and condensation protein B